MSSGEFHATGAVFDQMYGEGALEGEAERMAGAEEEPEEDFPTEYQPGGGEGDRPVPVDGGAERPAAARSIRRWSSGRANTTHC